MNTRLKCTPLFLLFGYFLWGGSAHAQELKEVTGKRLYEHHSPAVRNTNGAPGGGQSGYDFVQHDYVSSFDPVTFGPYQNGEEKNLDMVEHNGPSARGKDFGITSGYSSIWAGDIVGNRTTKWVTASSGFDYAAATDVADLEKEYQAGTPDSSIASVVEGGIYIAKIRETDQYVAMKCYTVTNSRPGRDIYFDFDYKYGVREIPKDTTGVGTRELKRESEVVIYPNPASDRMTLLNKQAKITQVSITSVQGQVIYVAQPNDYTVKSIDVSAWPKGAYFVHYQVANRLPVTTTFIKN